MSPPSLTPEQQARQEIDRKFTEAGWAIQNRDTLRLSVGRRVAVREFSPKTGFAICCFSSISLEVAQHDPSSDEPEFTDVASLQRAERSHHAILKRAFEGKLVPQEHNDEPALELMKRIQSERTSKPVQDRF